MSALDNATTEVARLVAKVAKLTAERDAEIARSATERQRYRDERANNMALVEERDRLAADIARMQPLVIAAQLWAADGAVHDRTLIDAVMAYGTVKQ